MAVVGHGAVDHALKQVGGHAQCGQAGGQAQARIHVANRMGNRVAVRIASAQAHGVGHALQALLFLNGVGRRIEAHHRWQKQSVQGAMVQARVDAAQAVTQAVHAAQTFLKGHGALHAGAHHVPARFAVLAVGGGAFNMAPATRQTVQANAVGRRVDGRRHKGFHAVGNGVHAGGRCQHGRQAEREFRVANGGFGHQEPAVEPQLASVVHDDDGAARYFAAGACGGGHCNQRQHPVSDLGTAAFNGGVGLERAFVRGGNANAFGQVQAGAATQAHQAIAAFFFE